MSSSSGPSRAGIVGGHVSTGIVSGTVFGLLYFFLEAVVGSWGHIAELGDSVARIAETYLLFGLVVGVGVGTLTGVVAALMRARMTADLYVPFYFSSFAFLAVFMDSMGPHSVNYVKSLATSVGLVRWLLLLAGLSAAAFLVARVFRRRGVLHRASGRAAVAAVVVCVAGIAIVHWVGSLNSRRLQGGGVAAAESAPNVVLILLDALRSDHVSAYGYHRETTPHIDELARDGVLFRRVYSHGNRTIISVPSLFTSLYPSVHGGGGYGEMASPLPEEWTTIAEVFRDKGYATIGLVPNVYFDPQFNLIQGFDRIDRFYAGRYDLGLYRALRKIGVISVARSRYRPLASDLTDTALRWLEVVKGRPYFLYLHYMDTHHPYAPPPPYDLLWGARENVIGPMELFNKTTGLLKESALSTVSEAELAKLIDYYDGSIRFADEHIGRLIERIRAEDERETIIVVTADHGDEFLEHGSVYHNNLVIEELIRVPLIIWSSERFSRGTESDELVRHIDLLPTLAELISADPPAQAWGQSLVPLLEGAGDSLDLKSIAEGDFCTSLNYRNWKMVRVDSTDSYHFYDLSRADPEKEDVCALYPEECAALRTELEQYFKRVAAVQKGRAVGLDEKTIRELKALGYL